MDIRDVLQGSLFSLQGRTVCLGGRREGERASARERESTVARASGVRESEGEGERESTQRETQDKIKARSSTEGERETETSCAPPPQKWHLIKLAAAHHSYDRQLDRYRQHPLVAVSLLCQAAPEHASSTTTDSPPAHWGVLDGCDPQRR